MTALTLARLSREWGHKFLITGPHDNRTYTATRLTRRGGDTDQFSVRTLRGLRRRLEQIDTDERDAALRPLLSLPTSSRPTAQRETTP